jgi:predicted DNA-binding antitoxin AbrB/MazE fold protein
MRTLEAKYENGVLRPATDLPLRPGEQVRIIVIRHRDANRWDPARLSEKNEEEATLTEAGLSEWASSLDDEDKA